MKKYATARTPITESQMLVIMKRSHQRFSTFRTLGPEAAASSADKIKSRFSTRIDCRHPLIQNGSEKSGNLRAFLATTVANLTLLADKLGLNADPEPQLTESAIAAHAGVTWNLNQHGNPATNYRPSHDSMATPSNLAKTDFPVEFLDRRPALTTRCGFVNSCNLPYSTDQRGYP